MNGQWYFKMWIFRPFSPGMTASVLRVDFDQPWVVPRVTVQGDALFAVRTVRMVALVQNQVMHEHHVTGLCNELVRFGQVLA